MRIERTVAATFSDEYKATQAIDAISMLGIPESEIGVLMSSGTSDKEFSLESKSKLFEGIAAGSTIGAAIGTVLGGLASIAGAPISGGASLIAAGPVFASLAGMGVGSGLGWISGALVGMGFEEYGGELIDRGLSQGNVLLAVTVTEEQLPAVRETFEKLGAKNISVARKLRSGSDKHQVTAAPPII